MKTKEITIKEKRARLGFPVAESMGQAAGWLGVPIARLAAAKRAGSKAFLSGSRVDTAILIPELLAPKDGEEILDEKTERARKLRLENEALERAAELEIKNTVTLEEVERIVWEGYTLPLRQALEALPEAVGPVANPENSEHAKKVLREWVEKTKRMIREPK